MSADVMSVRLHLRGVRVTEVVVDTPPLRNRPAVSDPKNPSNPVQQRDVPAHSDHQDSRTSDSARSCLFEALRRNCSAHDAQGRICSGTCPNQPSSILILLRLRRS